MAQLRAKKAKDSGKTVAKRPKGESKVSLKTKDVLALGDELASAVLNDELAISSVQRLARQWQKARK